MKNLAYRHESGEGDQSGRVVIPYEVQEFISATVHQMCSPERATKLLPVCFDALALYVGGDLLADLPLPEGCSNDGSLTAPVWLLVEELGLDLWATEIRVANGLSVCDPAPLVDLIPEELEVG